MNRKQLLALFTCVVVALAVAASAGAQAKKAAPPAANEDNLMDLNSAPLEKLMTLSGVDIVVAKKIVAGRPYLKKDQVVAKKVMTQEAFDKIARQVTAKQAPKGTPAPTMKKAAPGKKG